MSINIGLDIGAVSLKLAAIGGPDDGPRFRTLTEKSETFYAASFPDSSPFAGRALVLSRYRRLQGSPIQSTFDLLKELYDYLPEEDVEGIRVTGSGSQLIAKVLGIYFENEFRAIAKGLRTFYPQVRTVFEMGGEASKYLRLDPNVTGKHLGIVDYQTSGECAAGTGSFIDQQATRLLYSIEQVGPAACGASCAARIAGRCSVFAKTDMIHAQQKGYTTEQILRGLCDAVARNFKSSLVKGRAVVPPVAFIGGVAMNQGVRNALREAFKLKEADLLIPEHYAWLGAVGAAMLEVGGIPQAVVQAHPPVAPARGGAEEFRLHRSALHAERLAAARPQGEKVPGASVRLAGQGRCQVQVGFRRERAVSVGAEHPTSLPVPVPSPQPTVEAYLGIDIGSVSTNLVVIDADGNLLKEIYLRTQGRPIEVVDRGLKEIEAELGDSLDIRGVGTTGSGRELIGELVGADTVNDEITAHKTGSMHVCKQMGMEPVDTIFEIGGQDSKFIRIDKGVVVDFTMNEACAAGTGSFLEEQAEKLGISIKEEFAQLALASASPARLGERCTVFMERDVTGLMHKGAEVGDLCGGPGVFGGAQLPEPRGARAQDRQRDLLPGRHGLQRRRGGRLFADPGQAHHRAAAQRRDRRHRHGADRPRPHERRRQAQPLPRLRPEPRELHHARVRLPGLLQFLRHEGIQHRGAAHLLGRQVLRQVPQARAHGPPAGDRRSDRVAREAAGRGPAAQPGAAAARWAFRAPCSITTASPSGALTSRSWASTSSSLRPPTARFRRRARSWPSRSPASP